jgi:hypothetical protein
LGTLAAEKISLCGIMSELVGTSMPKTKFGESDLPNFPEEPEGWRELQERARNERDPRKLEAIIAEMNRLLGECEKRAAAGETTDPTSRRGSVKPTLIPE